MHALSSVLFVPATNTRAMQKIHTLSARAVIIDLEDALAPEEKQPGREQAARFLQDNRPVGKIIAVRINTDTAEAAQADLQAVLPHMPDAIVLPKVEGEAVILDTHRQMRVLCGMDMPAIWAMIETPKAILNLSRIVQAGRETGLSTLIAGTNDLGKLLRVPSDQARTGMMVALQQIVLHARAAGLRAIDGVYNDFSDVDGFAEQAMQGRKLGFDGKTLIHPAQIDACNTAFGPSAAEIKWAQDVLHAFSLPENAGKGAVQVDGEMVELLHLAQARALLAGLSAPD